MKQRGANLLSELPAQGCCFVGNSLCKRRTLNHGSDILSRSSVILLWAGKPWKLREIFAPSKKVKCQRIVVRKTELKPQVQPDLSLGKELPRYRPPARTQLFRI